MTENDTKDGFVKIDGQLYESTTYILNGEIETELVPVTIDAIAAAYGYKDVLSMMLGAKNYDDEDEE